MEQKTKGRYSELLKNTGILAIGSFSSKILIFLLVPLYTHFLSTEEYGYYDLVYTTIQLLVPILSLNVADGVLRFCIDDKKNTRPVHRISLKYIIASIVVVLLLLVILAFVGFSYVKPGDIWILLLYYSSYIFNQYYNQMAKGIDHVKDIAIAGVLGTLATVGLCILFLPVLHYGLQGFFIANILGQLIPALYLMIRVTPVIRLMPFEKDLVSEKRFLAYTLPLIFTNIGWWINNTSDRYIITWLKGVDVNGLVSVAYKLPSILTILYGVFIQAWQISAMKEYGKEDSAQFYSSVFIHLNYFLYILASGLLLFTPFLSGIMFSDEFSAAWEFVPFLTLSSVFTAVAGYIAPILTSAYDTKSVAISTIYGGAFNILLNIGLTLYIGAQGVAVATAASTLVILLYRYYCLQKPRAINKKALIKSVVMWIALVFQAIAVLYKIYSVQLLLIIGVLWINKDVLQAYIKKLSSFRKGRR